MGILDGELLAPCLVEFAAACGDTLAWAHARSGNAVAISSYAGGVPQFAVSHACTHNKTSATTRNSSAPSPHGREFTRLTGDRI
jgi:hypothetical protein